jgi:hypothetical protein
MSLRAVEPTYIHPRDIARSLILQRRSEPRVNVHDDYSPSLDVDGVLRRSEPDYVALEVKQGWPLWIIGWLKGKN